MNVLFVQFKTNLNECLSNIYVLVQAQCRLKKATSHDLEKLLEVISNLGVFLQLVKFFLQRPFQKGLFLKSRLQSVILLVESRQLKVLSYKHHGYGVATHHQNILAEDSGLA